MTKEPREERLTPAGPDWTHNHQGGSHGSEPYRSEPEVYPGYLWHCVKGDAGPWGTSKMGERYALSHRTLLGKDHIIERRPWPRP